MQTVYPVKSQAVSCQHSRQNRPNHRETRKTSRRRRTTSETPKCGGGAHVGFGGTERKRKGPCTKQCAWRKHGSCDTRLAEARPPKLWNTVKHRVEDMRPKWPFWKHRAPKMRLVEAQCAHRKHCYPENPLGSHPTSRASQQHLPLELIRLHVPFFILV